MSDVNVATMIRSELEQTANDLGVKFPHNASDDTLRKRITEQLGEPTELTKEAPAPKAEGKRIEITIPQDARDQQPVQVGLNGKMYLIKRGEKVIVPKAVVEILEHAVRFEYDPNTMKRTEVLSYPFTTHREL